MFASAYASDDNKYNLKTRSNGYWFDKTICYYAIGIIVVLLSAITFEYAYLTSLYLVDETYDVDIPKEWSIRDKITIR